LTAESLRYSFRLRYCIALGSKGRPV
jgi:hypothetical protein